MKRLISRTFLLLALGGILFFTGGSSHHLTQEEAATGERLYTYSGDGQEYLWMNYYRLQQGRLWMRLASSGRALYVRFSEEKRTNVKEVRTDQLSPARVRSFFEALERIQFFNLDDTTSSEKVEADILEVAAQVGQEQHQVSSRPPSHVPSGLMDLAGRLKSAVSTLSPVDSDRMLVKSLAVSEHRAQTLRESNVPQLASDTLSEYETIQSVVRHPDQFFLLSRTEFSRLPEKFADAPYFLVSAGGESVAVEFYPIEGTGA